jgi:hypothetical protein
MATSRNSYQVVGEQGAVSDMNILAESLMPKEVPAPNGTKCGACGSTNVVRTIIPVGGPYSGYVICNNCGERETVMSHIGRNMVGIVPFDETRKKT